MIEIIYKKVDPDGITIEHKATIKEENIDSIIYGAVSVIESEWGEQGTENAIRKYYNI